MRNKLSLSTNRRVWIAVVGILIGMALAGPAAQAAGSFWQAYPSTQPICLNGQQVQMTAYNINGSNYVKLRDVGKLVGFNVYWDGANVQVDSTIPYTGQAPASALPQPTPHPTPQPVPSTAPVTQDIEALRQEMVDRTNAVRLENGVSALPTDPLLMQAAQVRAEEIAATDTYSHTRPDGTDQHTVTDCPYTLENIHSFRCSFIAERGINAAEFSVGGWTFSPAHFQNMTRADRSAIGVGLARGIDSSGDECWYCVQLLLREGQHITWVDTPKIP